MQRVSIIIPFQRENDYLIETVSNINKLTYKNVEIILLPDDEIDPVFIEAHLHSDFAVQIFTTGAVSPSIKRDIGAEKCSGEILAFIDDDAYPQPDWLDKALPHFREDQVCGVGGPQVTPESDGFWQQVSGAMFLSALNGAAVKRYYPGKTSEVVEDWPTVNLLVRKSDFLKVGGFDSTYWPGEDTKLCYDLLKLDKKIIYEPTAIVYHHRRAGYRKHMKQVGNYALHRGYFVKHFPETSRKASYFIPSFFFFFVVFGWFGLYLGENLSFLYKMLWMIYGIAMLVSIISVYKKTKDFLVSLGTFPYIVGTHFVYGYKFFVGLVFIKDLKSKLGR